MPKKIYLAVESLIDFAEIQMNALFLVFYFFLFLGLNNNVRSSGFHKNLFMYDGSCKYCEIIMVYKGLLWITLAHDLHPQERTYKHVFNIDENTLPASENTSQQTRRIFATKNIDSDE